MQQGWALDRKTCCTIGKIWKSSSLSIYLVFLGIYPNSVATIGDKQVICWKNLLRIKPTFRLVFLTVTISLCLFHSYMVLFFLNPAGSFLILYLTSPFSLHICFQLQCFSCFSYNSPSIRSPAPTTHKTEDASLSHLKHHPRTFHSSVMIPVCYIPHLSIPIAFTRPG